MSVSYKQTGISEAVPALFPRMPRRYTNRSDNNVQSCIQTQTDSSSDNGRTAVPGDSVLTATRSFSIPASVSGLRAGFSAPAMTADGPMAAPGRPSLALSPSLARARQTTSSFSLSLSPSLSLFSAFSSLPASISKAQKRAVRPFLPFLFPPFASHSPLPPPTASRSRQSR